MKHVDGNLRPLATLSRSKVSMLPNARIQCASGRIRVGDRTYLSASDALSAYLLQFDGKQQPPAQHLPVPLSAAHHVPVSFSTAPHMPMSYGIDGLVQRAAGNHNSNSISLSSSSGMYNSGAANVTALLTGSPRGYEQPGMTLNSSSRGYETTGTTLSSSRGYETTLGSSLRGYEVPVFNPVGVSHFTSQAGSSHFTSQAYSSGVSLPNTTNTSHSYNYSTLNQDTVNSSAAHMVQSAANTNGLASSTYGLTSSTYGPAPSQVNGIPDHKNQYNFNTNQASGIYSASGVGQSGNPEVVASRARSEIETLMCTAPARREMALEAQDALREVKLKRLLEETKKRSESGEEKKSSLQQEVEEALSRSAQLLETIKTDSLASPRCVSDIGSLNTDILLSVNPYNPTEAGIGRQGRSRHRYSYHTPGHHHTRSLSLGRVPGSEVWQPTLEESGRRRSVDSLGPAVMSSFMKERASQDVNSSAGSTVSAMSEPSDILKHLQGLSSYRYSAGDKGEIDSLPHHAGPPSWIQELIPPTAARESNGSGGVTDSIFSQRNTTGGRAPPSWVNGMDQSDIASSVDTQELRDAAEVLAVTGIKALTTNNGAGVEDSMDLSYAGPGLNYSDLITSPAPNKHKVSFVNPLMHTVTGSMHKGVHQTKPASLNFQSKVMDRSRNGEVLKNSVAGVLKNGNSVLRNGNNVRARRDWENGKPPTGRIHQDLAGVDMVRPQPQNLSSSLSSSVGAADSSSRLRKKISEDSAEAKRTLDVYLSRLNGDDGERDIAGRTEALLAGIPRCSSLNIMNGIGHRGTAASDVTGASPITKDSNFSSRLCLDDPTLTPAKQARASHLVKGAAASPDGEDLLDGDRSWENLAPSFKAPVHVENCSPGKHKANPGRPMTPTLSGGQQPGSMEALKKMLFRLQTEEASGSAHMENGSSSLIPGLDDYNFEDEPGGQSLERALVHLGRLKTLVQTTGPGSKKETDQESLASQQ